MKIDKDDISNSELLNFLKDTVATKEDLKDLATKEDLKNAIAPLATKGELKDLESRMNIRFDRIDGNFTKMRKVKAIRKALDEDVAAPQDLAAIS